jgi:hypothetical protein
VIYGDGKPVNNDQIGKEKTMSNAARKARKAAAAKKAKAVESETKTEGQVLAEEANKEKDSLQGLKIARKDAVKLLEAMGFKTAHKASNDLLRIRLGKLKTYLESYEGTLTGDMDEVKDKVLKAGTDGVVVTGEEPKGAADKTENPNKKDKSAGKTIQAQIPNRMAKEKKDRKPREGGPSNKEQVWKLYQKVGNKDKASEKAETWFKEIKEAVKLTTIRGWIGDWNRGKNLPGCAKKTS